MSDAQAFLTSTLADRYTIERTLGQGGMATVHLAEERKHRRKVAIKVLKQEFSASVGAERFLRTGRSTTSHPSSRAARCATA